MKYHKLFFIFFLSCFLSLFMINETEAQQVVSGNVTLSTQTQVNDFIINNSIIGAFSINGNLVIGGTVTNLSPLDGLTSVSGILNFYYPSLLTEISGLNNLTYVGSSLNITGSASLTSISGLNGFTSLPYIDINSNPLLENINGFNNLTAIGNSLLIYSNASLVSLDGLSNLTALNGVGDLYIVGNGALTNLDGLTNLSTIGDHAQIISNTSLQNLDGLSSLTSIGSYLQISGNSSLSSFCGLYPLFYADGLVGSYIVSGNAVNPTAQDILDGGFCFVQDIQDLVTAVEDLNTLGTLNNGQANSLKAKLVGLKKLIDKGNKNAAVNKVNAFINHVEGFINGSVLTSTEGQALINAANSIISQINSLPKHFSENLNSSAPQKYVLDSNFPNPFNPTTQIRFGIPEASNVKIEVFNITGEKVATLIDAFRSEGFYEVNFNANGLSSGMYLYRINAGSFVQTRKMILMK